MRGAAAFAKLFETGQYGRLYIVSGSRPHGPTFRLFVLPAGEQAALNDPYSAPLNSHAVEVYDIDGASCGDAPHDVVIDIGWQQDFASLVEARCAACAQCAGADTALFCRTDQHRLHKSGEEFEPLPTPWLAAAGAV